MYLPWMPAWFLEGLAEAVSMSVGSDVMAGIERHQALTNQWPSYARLHSLYNTTDFGQQGYATAGSFTAWSLTEGDPQRLPKLLGDFFSYAQPWWWVWALTPFNGFLPMDAALETYAVNQDRNLYKSYKAAATKHWRQTLTGERGGTYDWLSDDQGVRLGYRSLAAIRSDGQYLYLLLPVAADDSFFNDTENTNRHDDKKGLSMIRLPVL